MRSHRIFILQSFLFISILISTPSFAFDGGIPQNEDFLIDPTPDGFEHKHEQRNYYNYIIEYLPEGQSLHNWTQMLSIIGMRDNAKIGGVKGYVRKFFNSFDTSCKNFKPKLYEQSKGEVVYEVQCVAMNNNSLQGGKNLKWEYGVYRFIQTKEMIYQIHFVTHGAKKISRRIKEKHLKQAHEEVKKISLCNLAGAEPCQSLDIYTSLKEPILFPKGIPPCRSIEALSCDPSAQFSVAPADTIKIDEKKKKALIFMDFSKQDPTDFKTLQIIFKKIAATLKSGAPQVILVIRGASRNVKISSEDRVKIGTFMTNLRALLIVQKVINADSLSFLFFNFK